MTSTEASSPSSYEVSVTLPSFLRSRRHWRHPRLAVQIQITLKSVTHSHEGVLVSVTPLVLDDGTGVIKLSCDHDFLHRHWQPCHSTQPHIFSSKSATIFISSFTN
ncbi:hypothetical protein HN873_051541 [Arachis hypogaea]